MTRDTDKDGYPTVCSICGQRILSTRQNGFHAAWERNGVLTTVSAHLACYLTDHNRAAAVC